MEEWMDIIKAVSGDVTSMQWKHYSIRVMRRNKKKNIVQLAAKKFRTENLSFLSFGRKKANEFFPEIERNAKLWIGVVEENILKAVARWKMNF